MDVDLIFKRGMAYTIAAAAIAGAYFAAVGGCRRNRSHTNFPSAGTGWPHRCHRGHGAALRSDQELDPGRLDKFFYRKRYDYRKTLIEFGRDLNSETDLDKMLDRHRRSPLAHAAGRSHGDLPRRTRR